MSQKIERRFVATEVRASTEGDKKVLEGYAAKYDTMSHDLGGFHEVIKPGTFDRAVSEKQDVVGLINHNSDQMFGRSGKNMTLKSDAKGLKFRAELPNTQVANDLYENVRNGLMEECSFGFIPQRDSWTTMERGGYENVDQNEGHIDKNAIVRELHDVDLKDVSVVSHPAYPTTGVKARGQVTKVELRAMFPDGIPEEVAQHMAEQFRAKTKTVSGTAVSQSDFAYVGDPEDLSTWKLPIHDKAHAQNALARFGQTQGIPADQKAAVHAKIVSAAKKFGVDVSEEKSAQHLAALELRHDKVADISALTPKVLEAMDSLEDALGDAKDSIDDDDLDSFDKSKGDLQSEVKALIALLGDLEKAVDKEVAEGDNEDNSRALKLRHAEISLKL